MSESEINENFESETNESVLPPAENAIVSDTIINTEAAATATAETEEETAPQKAGKLYIVSTHIGNHDDITKRALNSLKYCDIVVCEDRKPGVFLLKTYSLNKEIKFLNEQNEDDATQEIMADLLAGKKISLISDCGTPVFADPGAQLVKAAISRNIEIEVVPGASSIMTALVRSGFSLDKFTYGGFLDRDRLVRIEELRKLSELQNTVAILETPYRLMPILEAASKIMPARQVYLGCNLTMSFESHHYGTFEELLAKFVENRFKGEFVIVFEGNRSGLPAVKFSGGSRDSRGGDRRDNYRSGGRDFRRDDRRDDRRGGGRDFRRDDRRDDRRGGDRRDNYKSGGRDFKRDDRRSDSRSSGGNFRKDDRRGDYRSGSSRDFRHDDKRNSYRSSDNRDSDNEKNKED
jgi:16S rRNA (cytidine1402-2'-O)-methyltransferase